jgi:hypothetical protein
MRHLIIVALFLWLPFGLPFSAFAAEEPKLPGDAQRSMDKLNKSEAKLTTDYKKSVNVERLKTITELQKTQKDITKTGDLDGALAIKKQIEKLQELIAFDEDTDLLGNKKVMDFAKLMTGKWTFQKNNGFGGTFEAFTDGRVIASLTSPLALPNISGKWEAKGEQILITWVNDPSKLETLTFTAPNKLSGDSHDAGKNGFTANKLPAK